MNTKRILLILGLLTIITQSIFAGPKEDKKLIFLVKNKKTTEKDVEKEINLGADANVICNSKGDYYKGWTVLMIAAYNGYLEAVKALLKSKNIKVDLQQTSFHKQTALILAAYSGHVDIVKILINANANVNIQDSSYRTALFLAIEKNHIECVKALLNTPKINLEIPVALKDSYSKQYHYLSLIKYFDKKSEIKKLIQEALDKQAAAKRAQSALDLAKNPEVEKLIKEALDKQAAASAN